MVLKALNLIAVEQTKATVKKMAWCTQLLDYLLHNEDAKIHFHAPDMILNVHSDTAYLSEPNAWSHLCKHIFMEWKPKNGEPICLNGAFHVSSMIMKFIVASMAEAELGALYHVTAKLASISNSPWHKWVICNLKHLFIVTTPLQWALHIIQSRDNVCIQWKCIFFGRG